MKRGREIFGKAIKNNRLSHLYLLSGSKGVGKLDLALEVAETVLQPFFPQDFKTLFVNRNVPNLIIISPDGNTIKKEQIIALQDEFSKTSLIEGPRIYLIEEIEKMSTSAANSLLKFMEEPVSDASIGILLTNNISQVMPTIKSRAQIINLGEQAIHDVIDEATKLGVTPRESSVFAVITNDARQIVDYSNDPNWYLMFTTFQTFVERLNHEPKKFLVDVSYKLRGIYSNREVVKALSEVILIYFMDSLKGLTNLKPDLSGYATEIEMTSRLLGEESLKINIELSKDIIKKQQAYLNIEISFVNYLNKLKKGRS